MLKCEAQREAWGCTRIVKFDWKREIITDSFDAYTVTPLPVQWEWTKGHSVVSFKHFTHALSYHGLHWLLFSKLRRQLSLLIYLLWLIIF